MLGSAAAAATSTAGGVRTVSGGPLGAPVSPDPALQQLARCAELRAREERLLREVAAALGHGGAPTTPSHEQTHSRTVSVAEVEDLYLRCTSDYILDTNSEYPVAPGTENADSGGEGRRRASSASPAKRRSSTELYREAAALWGLSCRMSDSCRCLDCQSRYFDCDPDEDERPADLAAGTPALLDHVLTHPVTCSLL